MAGFIILIAVVSVGLLGMAVVYYLANQTNKHSWSMIQGMVMIALAAVLVGVMTAFYGITSKMFIVAVLMVGVVGMAFVFMVANKKTG